MPSHVASPTHISGAFHLIKLLLDEHAMFVLERRSSADLVCNLRSRCHMHLDKGKRRPSCRFSVLCDAASALMGQRRDMDPYTL